MRNVQDLPDRVTLPMPFTAFVHPHPGNSRGVPLTGHGSITLGFGPEKDGALDVRVEDIELSVNPLTIPFDLDGDGRMECIEVPYLTVGAEVLDLEACHGRFAPDTRRFSLTLVFQFDDSVLGDAARAKGEKMRLEVTENGYLHLENGRFETKANAATIENGPLKGLTMVNCEPGVLHRCFASLEFRAQVITPHNATNTSVLGAGAEPRIYKARSSPVRLLWEGKPAQQVEVRPGLGARNQTDYQDFPDLTKGLRTIEKTDVFAAKTLDLGECLSAEKTVDIIVAARGDRIGCSVPFEDPYQCWYEVLNPGSHDPALMIGEILIDGKRKDSVTHQKWQVTHFGIGSGVSSMTHVQKLDEWTPTGLIHTLSGTIRIEPIGTPPLQDYQRRIFLQMMVYSP